MKTLFISSTLLGLSAGAVLAGPVAEAPVTSPPISSPDAFSWITPTIDISARVEVRDFDGQDPSTAFTVRERLGLKFGEFAGFSAFVEGEFSQAIGDDFNTPGGSDPKTANNVVIADPETNELNRAWVQYKSASTSIKVGRQRLKYNGDTIIGNVGWRQNEQTFDAIRITNSSIDDLKLDYFYADRAQRIFGSDAGGGLEEWEGDFHFLNAVYTGIPGVNLTGYIGSNEFDLGPARADGQTFGLIAKGKASDINLYGEVAYHASDYDGAEDIDNAFYAHVKASKKFGSHTFGLGLEYLGEDFFTPFSTVHKFNGFADVYIGPRLGLAANGHGGIADAYIFHNTKLPFGIVWKNWFHYIDAEAANGTDLSGWEYDSVFVKKFGHGFTGLAKFYHFESDENNAPARTTTGFTVGLNYKF